MKCFDCPRNCGVDRNQNLGFCREGDKIRIAKIIPNFMWEEPCLTGNKGALAIFFSGCNLRCKFCQNYQISHIGKGEEYSPQEFKDLLSTYNLSNFSCIDLITPTHFSSLLFKALKDFNSPIPIVWNSSGYEKVETIKKVSSFVDIFLIDFKYYDNQLAQHLSCTNDYFEYASTCIKEISILKPNKFDNNLMQQGMIIRHLVLPENYKDSIKILDYIKTNINDPVIALMSQFTPTKESPIKERLKPLEFKILLSHAKKIGLNKGYFQDLSSSSTEFIPKF